MKRQRLPLTADEIAFAKSARKHGRTWRLIGQQLGGDHETVKMAVVPGFAEERAARIRQNRKDRSKREGYSKRDYAADLRAIPGRERTLRQPNIPEDIMAERDIRLTAPRSLTSILCGDPAPGQSALDKRRMNLSTAAVSNPDDKVGLSP